MKNSYSANPITGKMIDKIPPEHFCQNLAANVNNKSLSDKEFRQFVRSTLPIVNFPKLIIRS